jgi:opacity protein-like surface antigen
LGGGAIGGVHAGISRNIGLFVFGAEIDVEAIDLNESAETVGSNPPDDTRTHSTAIDFMASVRGRAGVLVAEDYQIYGTLGWTFTSGEQNFSQIGGTDLPQSNLTYGLGIEANLGQGISARVEYRVTDFGDLRNNGSSTIQNIDANMSGVRVGISIWL